VVWWVDARAGVCISKVSTARPEACVGNHADRTDRSRCAREPGPVRRDVPCRPAMLRQEPAATGGNAGAAHVPRFEGQEIHQGSSAARSISHFRINDGDAIDQFLCISIRGDFRVRQVLFASVQDFSLGSVEGFGGRKPAISGPVVFPQATIPTSRPWHRPIDSRNRYRQPATATSIAAAPAAPVFAFREGGETAPPSATGVVSAMLGRTANSALRSALIIISSL